MLKKIKQHRFFIQCLSILISALIVFSVCPINFINASAEIQTAWDGKAAKEFAGGEGTEASPFLIENASQLYKMVSEYSTITKSDGKYFAITKDIYINDVSDGTAVQNLANKKNWLSGYTSSVSKANSFCGTLDGGNNTIYGLYVSGVKIAGLFPAISSHANIKNLFFDNLFITGGSGYAGAIAGEAFYSDWQKTAKITNCALVNSTIGVGGNIEAVGGFVGDMRDCTITFTNCYSHDVSLSDWKAPGGIVGSAWGGGTLNIVNCYSIGYFPVRSNVNKANCTNVYTDTAMPDGNTTANVSVLDAAQMQGENARQNMAGFDFDRAWSTVDGGYPVHFVYVRPDYIWDGSKAENFAGGSGTAADPYLIENGGQLYKMVSEYSNAGTGSSAVNEKTYFKLANDIYLNDVKDADLENPTVEAWNALGFTNWHTLTGTGKGFCGELDGDGHTVSGLFATGAFAGLIPVLTDGGKIYNLNLKNSFVNGTSSGGSAGGVVGYVGEYYKLKTVSVSGCTVDKSVVKSVSSKAGGIIGGFGEHKFEVANCSVTRAKVISTSDENQNLASGLVGSGWGNVSRTVTNCFTDDSVHPVTATTDETSFNTLAGKIKYTNVYTSADKNFDVAGITYFTTDQIQGENAKQNMAGFDFDRAWKIGENGFPVPFVYERPSYVWDGTKAESFAAGSGKENDPYLIENGAQLYKMVSEYSNAASKKGAQNTKTYFKLTKDIYLNDVMDKDLENPSVEAWNTMFTPWYALNGVGTGFCGDFNGNGYTVYGLFANGGYAGLFPVLTDGGKIYNLNLKNSFVNSTASSGAAGSIVGYIGENYTLKAVSVSGCTVDNSAVKSVSSKAGGIIGGFGELKFEVADCSVTRSKVISTNAENPNLASGLVGSGWGNVSRTVTNCFTDGSVHPVTATTDETSFNTLAGKIKYTNVYTSATKNFDTAGLTYLTDEQMKGENAKQYMPGLDFERSWKTVEGNYPEHIIYVRPSDVWDGKKAKFFEGGNGTETTPYLIKNANQLYKMVSEYSDASTKKGAVNRTVYFKLIDDIYLNDVKSADLVDPTAESWNTKFTPWYSLTGVGTGFCGIFNGDGHTVYGLFANGGYTGLIPVLTDGGKVYNLNLKNSFINGSASKGSVGGIVGYIGENYTLKAVSVSGCTVDNSVVKSVSQKVGGIIGGFGELKFAVSDCSVIRTKVVSTNAENPNLASGLVGSGWGNVSRTVTNCFTDSFAHPVTATTDQTNFNTLAGKIKYTNVYTSAAKNFDTIGVTYLTDEQMKGENAKQYMVGFDFDRSWKTVAGDYPAHIIYARPDNVWNGKVADKFAGGSGTAYDPYLIENGGQLYKMVSEYSNASTKKGSENKTTYFKLTKDIYLNDINEKDLQNPSAEAFNTKFNPWYTLSGTGKGFCGELDGDCHTIYGLFATGAFAGLIPVLTDGGNVHHVNIENSFISGSSTGGSAGGVVGYVGGHYTLAPVSVTYSTVDNTIVNGVSKKVGGIIGGFEQLKITVSNCSVTRSNIVSTNAENPNMASAFIGNGWGITGHKVINCFTDSSVHPVTNAGDETNFKAIADAINYTNVYTSATKNFDKEGITYLKADSELKGLSVDKVLKDFDFTNDWSAIQNDYPAIRKGAGSWQYDTNKPGKVWSGKPARIYASGDGSEKNPYVIETGGQLALLANDALNGRTTNKYYKITEDIILNNTSSENWMDTANEWYTGAWAQAFRGHLDGGYHTISGLYLNKTKDNYTGTDYYGGLFACIGKNAVIEKLGIVNSSLTFTNAVSTKYLGVFAGFVDQYDSSKEKASPDEYPIIRECFADTTVELDGSSCGGFIGCATRPIRVEDSYFTGKVKSTSRGLFGYSKMGYTVDEALVKNFYTADSKYAVLSNASYDNIECENCYSSSAQDKEGLTRLFIDRMCGEAAKEYMKGFDFKKVWTVRSDNETPGLKGFNAKSYSNVMAPEDIVVSFETNCDLLVESITGKAYSKLTLPTLERDGYIFEGWYSFPELDVPFKYDYFPTFNTILYAKWTLSGFVQDFEQYEDSVYDYHEGYEYFRPTTENYSAKFAHGGAKSMHRLGGTDEELDFLLFYEEELEVGKTYKMVYYATSDQDDASVDVSLVHLDWPDVYSENKDLTRIGKLDNLKNGKWQEYSYTFVAKSKWIAIRTSGEGSVYFDDFTVYNTSGTADSEAAASSKVINGTLIVVLAVGLAVVAAGFVLTIYFIKKRKKLK